MENLKPDILADLREQRLWPVSACFLVAANAVPALLVFLSGWGLAELLGLYWLESAIIGLFTVVKMLLAGTAVTAVPPLEKGAGVIAKIFFCLFFAVHFGGFMAGHGVFLSILMKHFRLIGADTDIISFLLGLKIACFCLFVSHAYSFFANYLGGERVLAKAETLMLQPYPRIVVMHVTIIIGAWLMLAVGRSTVLLLLFTVLKTAVDLAAHIRERKRYAAA